VQEQAPDMVHEMLLGFAVIAEVLSGHKGL
jgi:hypothetical protein